MRTLYLVAALSKFCFYHRPCAIWRRHLEYDLRDSVPLSVDLHAEWCERGWQEFRNRNKHLSYDECLKAIWLPSQHCRTSGVDAIRRLVRDYIVLAYDLPKRGWWTPLDDQARAYWSQTDPDSYRDAFGRSQELPERELQNFTFEPVWLRPSKTEVEG